MDGKFEETFVDIMNFVERNYRVIAKKESRAIAGLSMGGMGTFDIVRRYPNLFAAAMPICGGANPDNSGILKKTSWWIFHGLKDNIVDPLFPGLWQML